MTPPTTTARVAVFGAAALIVAAIAFAMAAEIRAATAPGRSGTSRDHHAGWRAAGGESAVVGEATEGLDDDHDERWKRFKADLAFEGENLWCRGPRAAPDLRGRPIPTPPFLTTPLHLRC